MAVPCLNFFSSFSRIDINLFSLMITTRKQGNLLCQWLNFLSEKGLSLVRKCFNLSHLLSCMWLKNMRRVMGIGTCVGAATNRWQIKNKTSNIKMQKARISRPSLLYTCRCMMNECAFIIASHAINCNTLMGCYV